MIDLKLIGGRYVLTLDKGCILVLTKAELIQGLRRGKWLKRAQALAQRLAPGAGVSSPALGAREDPPPASGRGRP